MLGRTVLLINMVAGWAPARRIRRIDGYDLDTGHLCLVFDKRPQLMERPTVQPVSLRLPSRYPFADVLQIFKGDTACGVLRLFYQSFADAMIYITGKMSLLPASFLHQSFSRLRAFLLEFRSEVLRPVTDVIDLVTGVSFPVGVTGDIDHTQIYTEKVIGFSFWGSGQINRLQQKELAITKNKISLSLYHRHAFITVCSEYNGNGYTSVNGGNGGSVNALVGQDAIVKNHCTTKVKTMELFAIPFVGLRDFADGAYRHLCRQAELLTDVIIRMLVQENMGGRMFGMGYLRNIVTCRVKLLYSPEQFIGLFIGRQQLYTQGEFHAYNITLLAYIVRTKRRAVPPRSKLRGPQAIA